MGALDQIIKLRAQGLADPDIVDTLMQQGVSPKEIQDGLKQADIKNAVSGFENEDEMQPSIMGNENQEIPSPNSQEYPPQEEAYQENQGYADYPQQEVYSQDQQYTQDQQYLPQEGNYPDYTGGGFSPDTIIEIADQVFTDRIKKIQKQTETNVETLTILQTKFDNISERLKKIEKIIDTLEIAILEKVGSYGQNLESVKKEMTMMQESFSKMVSPKEE